MAVPFHTPVAMVPTLVKEELTTAVPRVVALSTDVPPILYASPVARLSPPVSKVA